MGERLGWTCGILVLYRPRREASQFWERRNVRTEEGEQLPVAAGVPRAGDTALGGSLAFVTSEEL